MKNIYSSLIILIKWAIIKICIVRFPPTLEFLNNRDRNFSTINKEILIFKITWIHRMPLLNNSIHKEEYTKANSFKYLNLQTTFQLLNSDNFTINPQWISRYMEVSHKIQFHHFNSLEDFKVQIFNSLRHKEIQDNFSRTLLCNSNNKVNYQS